MLDAFVEAAGRALIDVVIVGVFYWPGWLILRVVTLGRYPPPGPARHDPNWVAGVGLAVFLLCITLYFSALAG